MGKIGLIIKREYLTRVRNRTFILTTILTPLLFVILITGSVYLQLKGREDMQIAVVDNNGFFKTNLKGSDNVHFDFPDGVDTTNYLDKGYTAILVIPKFEGTQKTDYVIRSRKSIGFGTEETIKEKINAAIEDNMLQQAGVNRSELDSIHTKSQFATLTPVQEHGNKAQESNQGLAYGIGYASGILIYITMIIYGMMVLRGVMEEKTNRIAEVVVSSVKPFQLMMGKIIGIGAVGLTQFLMWVVLITVLLTTAQTFIPHDTLQQIQTLQQNGGTMPGGNMVQASESAQRIYNIKHSLGTANWPLIIGCFIFYFIGGYLFYASLFAAVGSVIEDIQTSQSMTLPITMPIIFSFLIMSVVVYSPDTPLAIWTSIIPFTSPTVMMARIAYGVPGTVAYWQLIVSMLLLVGGFLFTTWLAGKIYRTGILLYGKKVTWKEMIKWAFR
ncbi:MAG: ABC transporter permease [Bacteroidetes bacterium]|nr:ABC transporter permease [Bacteroidota bacterium]MBS1933019.1 ABC transporter permease [Bacteroidota bacterium]